MGGEYSGIQADTSTIIFESAKFARDSVRRTSRALNLRSDSSARYEKGIDFASQEYGLKRALTLIYETGSGEIGKGLIDVKVDYAESARHRVHDGEDSADTRLRRARKETRGHLSRLGIPVSKKEDGTLVAHVPDARSDIDGVNDIAEEFIRVYGYSHVKPTLFRHSGLTRGGVPADIAFRNKVKEELAAEGLSECITYSFTSPTFADKLRIPADSDLRKWVELVNPLGEALSVMRTVLTHSMLEVLAYNAAHFNKSAALFEIAKTYHPHSLPLAELPEEREKLVIGMYGADTDFFTLKGVIEGLFDALHVKAAFGVSGLPFLHPGRGADISADGMHVGFAGEIHPDVAEEYGADVRMYAAELDLAALYGVCKGGCGFKAFSKYPPVERDLAVVVADGVHAGDMIAAAESAGAEHLTGSDVFDVYRGAQVGEGMKSVAMSFTFSSVERTLTDDEIAAEMQKILSALESAFGAKIRA